MKQVFLLMVGLTVFFTMLSLNNDRRSKSNSPEQINQPFRLKVGPGEHVEFQILRIEKVKKGGSLNPPMPPQFTLLMVRALTPKQSSYQEALVEHSLRKIVAELIERHQPDGVTVRLFDDRRNLEVERNWIAEADWWPRGHSFSLSNADYVRAKEYHVFSTRLDFPVKAKGEHLVARLTEEVRLEIYRKIAAGERQAQRKADKRFPLENPEQAKINLNQNIAEADRLIAQNRRALGAEYSITEDEYDKIMREGVLAKWSL